MCYGRKRGFNHDHRTCPVHKADTEAYKKAHGSKKRAPAGIREAKAESNDCPKIQALRARLKQKYGETFFSGKPVFLPPVRGPYGEAKIRLKQDPRVYRHREFALRGERKDAMEKILRDFIRRGWLEPCHSE